MVKVGNAFHTEHKLFDSFFCPFGQVSNPMHGHSREKLTHQVRKIVYTVISRLDPI